jgi:heavy metal sensor kinase
MTIDSIRGRLTVWYASLLLIVLIASGMVSYAIARRQIQRSTDSSMAATAREFAAGLADEATESHGTLHVRSANELLADYRDNDRGIVLLTGDGREFAAHTTKPAKSLDRTLLHSRVASHQFGFATLHQGADVRLFLLPARIGGGSFVIAIAQSLTAQDDTLADLREAMLITIPLALLFISLGGYFLARESLAPVVRMSAKAHAISATNLSERIEVANARDELGQLAATLNDLLARLEESFAAQRRFMADASHELRSPIAILQGELDVTLSRDDRDAADYRDSLEVMRRSVRRLTRIVRDLFLLARTDAGEVPLKDEPVYLGDVIAQTVRAFRTLGAERQVTLVAQCTEDVTVRGDEDLLQRMTGNLIENAIKYTLSDSEVVIACSMTANQVRITVEDHGPGVPGHLVDRIFERFFRVDAARGTTRSKDGSGAGLGLPIARWIAEAHGGTLTLEKSDGGGSVFVATLPRTHFTERLGTTR